MRRKQLNGQGCQNITEDESAGLCSGLSRHHSCGVSLTRTQRDYANCPHLQILQSVQTEKPSCLHPRPRLIPTAAPWCCTLCRYNLLGRERPSVFPHTPQRSTEARIQVSGWKRNGDHNTSPTVSTIGEQIYNISHRDEERRPFSLE